MSASQSSNVPLLEVSTNPMELQDSAAVIEAIGKTVSEATKQTFGNNVRAVILTGSLARNEGSIRRSSDDLWKVQGDAEFLILLSSECSLPIEWDVERNGLEIEATLFNQGIECPISLGYCHEDFFRSMTPHMFAYETRVTGNVVSGEFDALSLIPPFTPAQIPLEDAWRTLSNRMIEVLEAMAAFLPQTSGYVPDDIAYRCMKLTLDTATSVLLFENQYAPTYAQRATNFSQLAANFEFLPGTTVSLRGLADAVTRCTEWKLSAQEPVGYATWNWVQSTCESAFSVWKWELQRLSSSGPDIPLPKLLTKLMGKQSMDARARGWLYVVRSEGWLKSINRWPRWLAMALRASPRYWTYEATGELFCRMGEYLAATQSCVQKDGGKEAPRNDLPLWPSGTRADSRDWRDFARAVAFNYHRYLEGTRA